MAYADRPAGSTQGVRRRIGLGLVVLRLALDRLGLTFRRLGQLQQVPRMGGTRWSGRRHRAPTQSVIRSQPKAV
jgi:hypothetical protein